MPETVVFDAASKETAGLGSLGQTIWEHTVGGGAYRILIVAACSDIDDFYQQNMQVQNMKVEVEI